MAILTKEEYQEKIKSIIGEKSDDDSLKFVEDMMDTYNAGSAEKVNELEKKYEELDNSWREKYKKTFLGEVEVEKEGGEDKEKQKEGENTPKTFNDLFKEGK